MKLEDFEYNLINQIYEFDGLWGVQSRCGIKIVRKEDQNIVILTDLYELNSGSSVTDFCKGLANKVCNEHGLNPSKTIFIQHAPEVNSSLDFYEESFDIVSFQVNTDQPEPLSNPSWKTISRSEVLELIS